MRFVIACLASVLIVSGQNSMNFSTPPGQVEPATVNLPAQRIGPDDLISLFVYDSPELSRTIRVGPDGFIRLPMLKQRVRADGLMPDELEVAVAEALKKERLLVDPVVTVTLAEYHSRPISVLGAVRMPVAFQAIGNVTLIDALTRAEGLSNDASGEILVSRVDGIGNRMIPQRISYRQLIDGADPSLNLRLTGGEEIRVPMTDKIVVVGNVRKPGQFPISDNGAMTVMKAIALSEGLTPFAAKVAYIERTSEKTKTKTEIPVELRRIVDRKAQDVELQSNDLLYIPDDRGSRLTVTTLEKILGFGATTGSGFLIWH
jgi:polysaccharide biosynthesis/export protein